MQKISKIFFSLNFFAWLLFNANLNAQHRGDNLMFQGLSDKSDISVKAAAMGNAFTSLKGDVSSLFYNPAGLAKINKIQVSATVNNYNKLWRENQNYRPDRYFVTLPFYLEGLYVPDPKNNGKWDYQLAQDTLYNYNVSLPQLGLDPYSEEAADWSISKNKFGFNSVSAAIPIPISDKNLVVAISYNRNDNFYDFDRNDTYLDPHIGYFDYGGNISRVDGKTTLNMQWSRFLRERFGSLNNITGGLGYEVLENLMLGVGVNVMWGESTDMQSLIRVGDFLLNNQQRFMFTYINSSNITSGTSTYNSSSFNLGAILDLNRVRVGLKVELPYTLKREWNYKNTITDSSSVTKNINGIDEYEFPAIYNIGVGFNPVDRFTVAFDYQYAPYNKAKVNLTSVDPTFSKWVTQNTLRFGAKYDAFDFLSLMAGYRSIPQTYIPDGAASNDKGPEANSYNFGFSLKLFVGVIDVAFEWRTLKYYDQYFSNTNYVFERNTNLMIGYTYTF